MTNVGKYSSPMWVTFLIFSFVFAGPFKIFSRRFPSKKNPTASWTVRNCQVLDILRGVKYKELKDLNHFENDEVVVVVVVVVVVAVAWLGGWVLVVGCWTCFCR